MRTRMPYICIPTLHPAGFARYTVLTAESPLQSFISFPSYLYRTNYITYHNVSAHVSLGTYRISLANSMLLQAQRRHHPFLSRSLLLCACSFSTQPPWLMPYVTTRAFSPLHAFVYTVPMISFLFYTMLTMTWFPLS